MLHSGTLQDVHLARYACALSSQWTHQVREASVARVKNIEEVSASHSCALRVLCSKHEAHGPLLSFAASGGGQTGDGGAGCDGRAHERGGL